MLVLKQFAQYADFANDEISVNWTMLVLKLFFVSSGESQKVGVNWTMLVLKR